MSVFFQDRFNIGDSATIGEDGRLLCNTAEDVRG